MNKTNAMRLLTQARIKFEAFEYEYDENDLAGVHAAAYLNISPEVFYKTLVLKGAKNGYFVCCIPCDKEVDLKKAASAMNDKSAEMLHVKDLLAVTGYIRGGCSPVGMKKRFPTFFDNDVMKHGEVYVSAGTRGCAIRLNKDELIEYVNASVLDITK